MSAKKEEEDFPYYSCPTCGWNRHLEDLEGKYYYYDEKTNKVKICPCREVKSHNRTRMIPVEPRGVKAYPMYSEFSYDGEGNPNWTEKHFCPKCKEEFEYDNGV